MPATRVMFGTLLVGVMLIAGGAASGQEYPSKPIRMVTGPVGGTGDFGARTLAQGLAESLGQQVVVDNRGGTLPAEFVAKAAPDGYVVLLDGGSFWISPLLVQLPYDPVRDYSPVAVTTIAPLLVVVHPSLPVKSIKDLIALAKAKPGELNFATGNSGSFNHLAGELFKAMAGVNMVRIPYKGGGLALNDLLGGQVLLTFTPSGPVMPHIKSGRLRALAVSTAQPSAILPGIPTIAASGVPGYEAAAINGVFMPAKAPDAVVRKLSQEIVRVLNRADVKERLLTSGVEVVGGSPEQLAVVVKTEVAKWGKLIKDAGIRAD